LLRKFEEKTTKNRQKTTFLDFFGRFLILLRKYCDIVVQNRNTSYCCSRFSKIYATLKSAMRTNFLLALLASAKIGQGKKDDCKCLSSKQITAIVKKEVKKQLKRQANEVTSDSTSDWPEWRTYYNDIVFPNAEKDRQEIRNLTLTKYDQLAGLGDRRYEEIQGKFEAQEDSFNAKLSTHETKFDTKITGLENVNEKLEDEVDAIKNSQMEVNTIIGDVNDLKAHRTLTNIILGENQGKLKEFAEVMFPVAEKERQEIRNLRAGSMKKKFFRKILRFKIWVQKLFTNPKI